MNINFDAFKQYCDEYMASPEVKERYERMNAEQIEYRNKRNIPIGFTYAQEDALEVLRDLYDEQVDEVLTFFQKERAEKKHKKELQEEEEQDIYDSRD